MGREGSDSRHESTRSHQQQSSREDRDRSPSSRRQHRSSHDTSPAKTAADGHKSAAPRATNITPRVCISYDDEDEEDESTQQQQAPLPPPPADVRIEDIKPAVSESGQEISMSIAETNRVRALLGLRPLDVGPSARETDEQKAVENMRVKKEEDERLRKEAEVRRTVDRARNQRLLKQKLEGSTLSDVQAGEEAVLSAADWVKQSRQKQVQNKATAAQRAEAQRHSSAAATADEQSSYDNSDLSGMRVAHDASAFEAGESAILTLADCEVLDTDEHGIVRGVNADADELENVSMTETQRRREAEKRSKRAAQGAYRAFDDEEFEAGGPTDALEAQKKRILSHYDEDQEGDAKRKKQKTGGMVLGSGGSAQVEQVRIKSVFTRCFLCLILMIKHFSISGRLTCARAA